MMKAFTHLISNLNRWSTQKQLLARLSEFHFQKAIKYERYIQFGQASRLMIKEMLGEAATPEVDRSWNSVYGVLMATMLRMQLDSS
mmetsp:Transcript_9844/g.14907  ORF Transcript_9844/g.14907 Transcript_9844/m.14907 type:complete len:86 (+) Transcript_9844:956-1213(+)